MAKPIELTGVPSLLSRRWKGVTSGLGFAMLLIRKHEHGPQYETCLEIFLDLEKE